MSAGLTGSGYPYFFNSRFIDFTARRSGIPVEFESALVGSLWEIPMPWRSKEHTKLKEHQEFTGFLDSGVRFEGTFEASGVFRVNGQVKGNLISTHSLILGEDARVEGQIEGNHVVIAGKFDGVVFAKGRVEIQARGVVTGEIHSPCLVIEAGGIFDGHCHMLAASESAKPLTIPIRAAQ
jgi:cytoskeletal protein CcmA (bactofilin family)